MGIDAAFQTALYTLLTADAPLVAATQSITDIGPQVSDSGDSSAFPYLQIGQISFGEDGTHTENGYNVTFRTHVWSRSGSGLEAKTIQALLWDALHRNSGLSIAGHTVLFIDRTDSFLEPDPANIQHGVCEWQALISEN